MSSTALVKKKKVKKVRAWKNEDLIYALESAAEVLEEAEWPGNEDGGAQKAAYQEAAKRIKRMASRIKI